MEKAATKPDAPAEFRGEFTLQLADADRFDGSLGLEGARSKPDYWPAWIFGVINPM